MTDELRNGKYALSRFVAAHGRACDGYETALGEIKAGKKRSHWIWYIFPQLRGLGRSETSAYYGIRDLEEARAFLAHPVLGAHLAEISEALLQTGRCDARAVMGGEVDAEKLKSSMTLFAEAAGEPGVFHEVLEQFFCGAKDRKTLKMLGIEK